MILSRSQMGQIMEKPQGLSGKSSPRGESAPSGLPSENPVAFRFPRGGNFSRYHPRLFHNLSDFGFPEHCGALEAEKHFTHFSY